MEWYSLLKEILTYTPSLPFSSHCQSLNIVIFSPVLSLNIKWHSLLKEILTYTPILPFLFCCPNLSIVFFSPNLKNSCVCVLNCFSCFWFFVKLCSWGFSRPDYWGGLPFPLPGHLPHPGVEPISPVAPALQLDSLPLSHQGSPSVGTL